MLNLIEGDINSESIGKMLSAVTCLARNNGIDAEEALSKHIDSFIENDINE